MIGFSFALNGSESDIYDTNKAKSQFHFPLIEKTFFFMERQLLRPGVWILITVFLYHSAAVTFISASTRTLHSYLFANEFHDTLLIPSNMPISTSKQNNISQETLSNSYHNMKRALFFYPHSRSLHMLAGDITTVIYFSTGKMSYIKEAFFHYSQCAQMPTAPGYCLMRQAEIEELPGFAAIGIPVEKTPLQLREEAGRRDPFNFLQKENVKLE